MSDEAIDGASQEAVAPDANESAESSTAPVETEQDTPSESEGEAPADPKRKPWFQSRIDELTAARRSAERENEILLSMLEQFRAQAAPEQPAPAAQGKPQLDQFDSYDAYTEALAEWKFQELRTREMQETARREAQSQAERQQQAWEERLTRATASNPELSRVVDELGPLFTTAMADVVKAVDNGPQLLEALDRDREALSRILALPPHMQAFQLGTLAASLPQPKPRQQTPSKPPPPDPLQTLRGGGAPDIDPSQMTDAQFAQWRRAQIAARNSR